MVPQLCYASATLELASGGQFGGLSSPVSGQAPVFRVDSSWWTLEGVVSYDTNSSLAGGTDGGAGVLIVVSANRNLAMILRELIQRAKSRVGRHKDHHRCSLCPRPRLDFSNFCPTSRP